MGSFLIDGKMLVSEGQLIRKTSYFETHELSKPVFCKNNPLKVIFKTTRFQTLIVVYKAGRKKVNIICTIGYLPHKVCNLVVFKTTGVLSLFGFKEPVLAIIRFRNNLFW